MVGFTRDRVGAIVVAVVAVSVAAAQADVLFVDGTNCPGPGDGSALRGISVPGDCGIPSY